MYRSALYVGKNAADLFQEMEETTKYLYNYNITEYDYLYELMEDDTITQARREALMSDVLRDILYMNQMCIRDRTDGIPVWRPRPRKRVR